jgi:uncharacterized SAM-binding protein YcdF (DUF218 family)
LSGKGTRKIWRLIIHILKWIIMVFGVFGFILFLLSFTTAPYYIMHWLGTHDTRLLKDPDYIIVMGGSSMPGEENLMRTWYAAEYANIFPGSRLVITLPSDSTDSISDINLMKKELIMRGINADRIQLEPAGHNTREEALKISKMISNFHARQIAIVTSPFHMRRSILTFRNAGFCYVGGLPAFEGIVTADLSFDDKKLGGNRLIPGVGTNLTLRYQFWNHLKYEILELREFFALIYYQMKGWI